MDKDHLLQITNELYRLTLLFPKKEPLRYKTREIADEVLASFVFLSHETHPEVKITTIRNSEKMIEVIDGFLGVAMAQNWVKASDILKLQEGYSKIKAGLIKFTTEEESKKAEERTQIDGEEIYVPKEEKIEVSERQKKILEVLKDKGKAQVGEMKDIFPDISKRTLRRDFKALMKVGLVERIGEKNTTFYQIKSGT